MPRGGGGHREATGSFAAAAAEMDAGGRKRWGCLGGVDKWPTHNIMCQHWVININSSIWVDFHFCLIIVQLHFVHLLGHVLEEGGHVNLADERADRRLLAQPTAAQNVLEGAPKVAAEEAVDACKVGK